MAVLGRRTGAVALNIFGTQCRNTGALGAGNGFAALDGLVCGHESGGFCAIAFFCRPWQIAWVFFDGAAILQHSGRRMLRSFTGKTFADTITFALRDGDLVVSSARAVAHAIITSAGSHADGEEINNREGGKGASDLTAQPESRTTDACKNQIASTRIFTLHEVLRCLCSPGAGSPYQE